MNIKSTLVKCSTPNCGTSFAPRNPGLQTEDDPSKCLTCNRSSWSKLWKRKRSRKARPQPVDLSIVLPYARVKE